MASSRIIREGWIDSPRINSLSSESETFFLRLCLRADDHGRYHANPKLLSSYLYPLKTVSESKIRSMLDDCRKAGLIILYESGKLHYLQVKRFGQRVRSDSKFPSADNCQQLTAECGQVPTNDSPEQQGCPRLPADDGLDADEYDDEVEDVLLGARGAHEPDPDEPFWSKETSWQIKSSDGDLWLEAYPRCDLGRELTKMEQWLLANPAKSRKKLWRKFITGWLSRAEKKNAPNGFVSQPRPFKNEP